MSLKIFTRHSVIADAGKKPVKPRNRLSPRDPFSAIYHGVAAYAQFVGKNYSEAISLSREAVRLRGDFSGTYRVLTVAAGMVRQTEVATAALPAHDPDQTG
jgi:hypothetical protein